MIASRGIRRNFPEVPMRYFLLTWLAAHLSPAQQDTRALLEPFLETHCYECHDDIGAEAELNLLGLKFDPADPANFATWERVFRKVHEGEMPPKENKRPPGADLEAFLSSVAGPLHETDRSIIVREGRVQARRLTREEYENSVHDLLGVGVRLQDSLTADSDEGFTNTAAHQQLSHFHLENYLNASDIALEEAFSRILGSDPSYLERHGIGELTHRYEKGNYRGPEKFGKHVVSWNMGVQFYGRLPETDVPEDGWYDVTIHSASGINRGDDGAVWATLNSGAGQSNEPLQFPIGLVEGAENPSDQTFRAWIRKGHCLILKPSEGGKKSARSNVVGGDGGTVIFKGRNLEKEGYDGLSFTAITVKRVHPNGSRAEVMAKLFPGLDENGIRNGPGDAGAAKRLLGDFARRAFRRPVDGATLAPYVELVSGALKSGDGFAQAMRQGYHAMLCSPNFLTFHETPGSLGGHAIASRLSYMLWKSIPDAELLELARSGGLQEPAVISAQIDRMLADPKSSRFITSFTDQWLELRDMDATQPDPVRFRDFDSGLQQAMAAETRAFVSEMIAKDLPVGNFLKSDFAFLDTRLQTHYGLGKLKVRPGGGLQKVALPPGSRSGLLTQGAILKVTADGSVTSPVVRGVFVNERILGRHIDPPPPNIPAIEPDTRGAVSVRDLLDKHRDSAACASCHAKIDPAGFALEGFDPVGSVREFYGKPKKSARIDPSGTTPEGRDFADFDGWREIQLARPEMLAEAFVGQLLRYGTGGEIRFSDKDVLKKITQQARNNGYGLRTLLKATLTSQLFLEK
ncbi:DUF1592 domain-containing protein [Akkermansiaceae bacterium]|nr:DUF1592 domain-containing protein [Akkermansiaceae bacterium]